MVWASLEFCGWILGKSEGTGVSISQCVCVCVHAGFRTAVKSVAVRVLECDWMFVSMDTESQMGGRV